jgi:MFS family permease
LAQQPLPGEAESAGALLPGAAAVPAPAAPGGVVPPPAAVRSAPLIPEAAVAARPLLSLVGSCWALLLGMALLSTGNGLQGPLLALRAVLEGFSTPVTGAIMSCYFLGFLAGSVLAPRLVARVGHVRVFAALASLASAAILWAVVVVSPLNWAAMRFVIGFGYAGIYVVAESWLNDRSSNAVRGQMLSVYVVIMLLGMGFGPLLLNLADPAGFVLFMAVSVLVSLAMLPMLLGAQSAPPFDVAERIGLRELYRDAPVGVMGCVVTGVSNAAFLGMAVVYAQTQAFSVMQSALLVSAAIWGGMLTQWPVGYLSDRYERRRVLGAVTVAAGLCAAATVPLAERSPWGGIGLMVLFGGLSFPMYSLSLAHANDRLAPSQMVAASSALVLVTGLGAALGPFTAAVAMSLAGPWALFWFLAAVHLALGLFAAYRILRRTDSGEQVRHVHVPRTSAVAAAAGLESARDPGLDGNVETGFIQPQMNADERR